MLMTVIQFAVSTLRSPGMARALMKAAFPSVLSGAHSQTHRHQNKRLPLIY